MIESLLSQHLRQCAEAYGSALGLQLSTVAKRAIGDSAFFDKVDSGCTFTARRYDTVMDWFVANWPEGAPWPIGVPRPTPAENRNRKGAPSRRKKVA